MKIFYLTKRVIQAVVRILLNPKNLFYVLNNEELFQKKVMKEYRLSEFGCQTIQFEDLNISFPQKISTYSFLGGTSSMIDFILLKGIAQGIEKCRYFEIGTWRGESILNLQDVVSHSMTLNMSREELKIHGYSDYVIEAQNFYVKDNENIIKLEGNSTSFNFSSIKEVFDLVFIDGDHHWKVVEQDTINVFQHLVHDQTIVVWHDYKINYSTVWWEVLYGILKGLNVVFHKRLFHVRNTNCLVYLPFSVKAVDQENPFLPDSRFSVTVEKV